MILSFFILFKMIKNVENPFVVMLLEYEKNVYLHISYVIFK